MPPVDRRLRQLQRGSRFARPALGTARDPHHIVGTSNSPLYAELLPEQAPFFFDRFDGGLNLRDQESQLAPSESPDLLNVTFDERGAIEKRFGYSVFAEIPGAGPVIPLLYRCEDDDAIVRRGLRLFRVTRAGVVSEITRAGDAAAFTTTARASAVEFAGELVVGHEVDRVSRWAGSGNLTTVSGSPACGLLGVWQNAVWAAGDQNAERRTRLFRCGRGNVGDWDLTGDGGAAINDIRARDDSAIRALIPSLYGGMLVGKTCSMHYVTNSVNGDFHTIDVDFGIPGPGAVASFDDLFYIVGREGIVLTNGQDAPKLISQRVSPLFRALGSDVEFASGGFEERLVFTVSRPDSDTRPEMIEFDPRVGWFSAHDIPSPAFLSFGDNETLLMGSREGGKLYRCFDGWSDDGVAIPSHYRGSWVQPNGEATVRLQEARIRGRGKPNISFLTDFNFSQVYAQTLDLAGPSESIVYDGSLQYGASESTYAGYGTPALQTVRPGLKANAFCILLSETSKAERQKPAFGVRNAVPAGSWSINQAQYFVSGRGRRSR